MIRRFLLVLFVALVLQGTAFAVYYDDLLFLHRPLSEIVAVAPDEFVRHARAALERRRLTVRHLDTIAAGARAFQLPVVEVSALERRVRMTDENREARFRLADALRRAGRLAEAQDLYLDLLASAQP